MRSQKPRVRVDAVRDVNTYAELWHGARTLHSIAKDREDGSKWTSMAALTLAAFTFEAYLNHVGSSTFSTWKDLESLSPMQKLAVVSERLKIQIPTGARPGQTVKALVAFRNSLAHGKALRLVAPPKLVSAELASRWSRADRPVTEWEKLCEPSYVERAIIDLGAVIEAIHKASPIRKEPLFAFGTTLRTAKLQPDS